MPSLQYPCIHCGKMFAADQITPLSLLRPQLAAFARERFANKPQHPGLVGEVHEEGLSNAGALCHTHLNELRGDYVRSMLADEVGELGRLEEDVVTSLRDHNILSASLAAAEDTEPKTLGSRASDRIASFGGSWIFILGFVSAISIWIMANVWHAGSAFDPYPFILLNLVLSCVAALQAPIIMMSQRRQEHRDRGRAESDYRINLKAELEIRHLNEKMDHLLRHNTQRLFEIQAVQTDLLREISKAAKNRL